MATLIDTSLWVDFTRHRTPQASKLFLAPFILSAEAHLAEPILFEVLRYATPTELRGLKGQFDTVPILETPAELWNLAAELGQTCRGRGFTAGSLDLLIATIAIFHQATLITLDADYESIAAASNLRVELLRYPPDPRGPTQG